MSLYQKVTAIGKRFVSYHILFKYGFNWSPMYRRSTARIIYVSDDLMTIRIRLPWNYKNKNYVNSIFGGSMFSAVDPIPMTQLMNLIGSDYVVWDKSAQINFRKPAKTTLFADFEFTSEELETIKKDVASKNEIEILKTTQLMDNKGATYCTVVKTIYVADKTYYKSKRKKS